MANVTRVYQQVNTFSVPREDFLQYILLNKDLSKKDLRVALILLTELDGAKMDTKADNDTSYRKVNVGKIADNLDLDKADVKKSLDTLCINYIIEKGNSINSKNGYRFTF